MRESKIRIPAVAGQFYPSKDKELKKQIASFTNWNQTQMEVVGCLLPHAGYIYSGMVVAEVISRIIIKENVIILGPNHTGYGQVFSLMSEGKWQTPLGEIEINSALAKGLLNNSLHIKADNLAHLYEHSIEVELPFLQYKKSDFKIVPLVIGPADLKTYKEVGRTIALTIEELKLKDSCLIVASSDMTHYESEGDAKTKDAKAIEAILSLDEDRLWDNIHKFDISMCGYAPTIIMLVAAKILGAKKASLIKYQTSGEVTRDYASVVGYAGITVY
ncbi:MAG: AmmeMemoRadiSam system protein B [Candidatus Omnitrophica bacterium]|nr:AmmeMemoRadiSam system protein B [Candidatus Omnitrophota bacterium]